MSERDTLGAQRVVKLPFFKFLDPPSSARPLLQMLLHRFYRRNARRLADIARMADDDLNRVFVRGSNFFLQLLLTEFVSRQVLIREFAEQRKPSCSRRCPDRIRHDRME